MRNLRYLTRAGGHWIAGERMRDGFPEAKAALARQGRYQTVRDNLRVKEQVGEGDAEKLFIICHNPAEAERERTRREQTITRFQGELERIDRQRSKAKSAKAAEGHTRAECALRDHPALGRYLRQPLRKAASRPRQDRRRREARRQVPALNERPRPGRQGRRARL